MSGVQFDTHRFVSNLKQAGMSEDLAATLATSFKDAMTEANLATKADIETLKWMVGTVVVIAIGVGMKMLFS